MNCTPRHPHLRWQEVLLCFLAFCFLFCAPANALDPQKGLSQYVHSKWSTDDGLPQNTVMQILQTRDGYLWLGTQAGLARFDGKDFKVFIPSNTPELQDGYITALCEDKTGTLWIGTSQGGLTSFRNGRFHRISSANGLVGDRILALASAADGSLWVGGYGGISQIRDGRIVRTVTTNNGITGDPVVSLQIDRKDALWVSTLGGLFRLDGASIKRFDSADGLHDSQVWRLYLDTKGMLWVRTANGGFQRFIDGKFVPWKIEGLPAAEALRSIYEDRDGNLWVTTTDSGLYRVDSRDGRLTQFTTKQGLTDNHVLSIQEDRGGNLWIGTFSGGLNRLRDGSFTTYGKDEGLASDSVWSVIEDRSGDTWIGTESGLNRIHEGVISTFNKADGLTSDIAWSLAQDKSGDLWIGSRGDGMTRFGNGSAKQTLTKGKGLRSGYVRAVYEDRFGDLWIGTMLGGLVRYSGGAFTQFTTADGLADDSVNAIAEDSNGMLWVATENGLNQIRNGHIVNDGKTNLIADTGIIQALYADKNGVLWLGTVGRGLFRYKNNRFMQYTTMHGLPDDMVYSILEDAHEHLWISSNKGVFRVDKKQLDAIATHELDTLDVTEFGRNDGLKSVEGNGGPQPSAWRARDGKLWFTTVRGVTVVDPEKISRDEHPPKVQIEAMTADEVAIPLVRPVVLPAGTNRFEIRFTAPSLSAPEHTRFRYRMEGFDKNWVDARAKRSAEYTNLAPGTYHFRVSASSETGVWDEQGTSFEFQLEPFFYQTWWFRLILTIAGATLLWCAYRLRVRWLYALAAVLQERQRIASDLHDSLAQGLSGVMMQIDAASLRLQRSPDDAKHHLHSARELAKSSLDEARQSVWNLRSPLLEGGNLLNSLKSAAQLLASGTETTVETSSSGVAWVIRPDAENELLRITQEAVANAIQHGHAIHVSIELNYASNCLTLVISDDGSGFDASVAQPPQDNRGFGLNGMQHRVQMLSGSFELTSAPGQGVRIMIKIPRYLGIKERLLHAYRQITEHD
ncbi:MAG: two-component regulator propeller domain-containing protein [Arenimonas sp.]